MEIDIISLENKLAINLESGLKVHCDLLFDKTNLSHYNAIYLPGGVGAKWFNYEKWGKPHPSILKLEEIIKKFLNDNEKYVFVTNKSFEAMQNCFENKYENSTHNNPLVICDNYACVYNINYLYDFTLAMASKLIDIEYDFTNHSFIVADENGKSKLDKIRKEVENLDEINKAVILNSINRFSVI